MMNAKQAKEKAETELFFRVCKKIEEEALNAKLHTDFLIDPDLNMDRITDCITSLENLGYRCYLEEVTSRNPEGALLDIYWG